MRGKIISCCAGRPAEGRIGLHDLLRAFAAAQSWEEDAQTTRDAAVRRLGEDLLEAAWAATEALYTGSIARSRTPGRRVIAVSGAEGSAWLRGELGRLVAVSRALAPWAPGFAVDLGVDAGHDAQQGRLTGAVEAEHADLGAREERQGDVLEDFPLRRHDLAEPMHGIDVLSHEMTLVPLGDVDLQGGGARQGGSPVEWA